jgi:hypothetical protein
MWARQHHGTLLRTALPVHHTTVVHHATVVYHAPWLQHVTTHGPEFLALFRRQQLAEFLHGSNVGKAQVSFFPGHGLELLLHLGEIHRVSGEQLAQINPHRPDLGSEANAVLGVGAQEGLGLRALLIRQPQLIRHAVEMALEHAAHT